MQCIEDHKFLRECCSECCSECCIEAASASTRIRILMFLDIAARPSIHKHKEHVVGGKIILIRLVASPMDSLENYCS